MLFCVRTVALHRSPLPLASQKHFLAGQGSAINNGLTAAAIVVDCGHGKTDLFSLYFQILDSQVGFIAEHHAGHISLDRFELKRNVLLFAVPAGSLAHPDPAEVGSINSAVN